MTEYKLHFIGQGLYGVGSFTREAQYYGVQRAVPFTLLKTLNWGDNILLARFINTSQDKRNKIGEAEVFGYFTITGITNNVHRSIILELDLDVVSSSSASKTVTRACGRYTIGGFLVITNSLPDSIEKIEKALLDLQEDPNKFKWFINGKYHPLASFILKPISFARGLVKVQVAYLSLDQQRVETANLVWIFNYQRREYMNKFMKERFEASSNTSFLDSFGGE